MATSDTSHTHTHTPAEAHRHTQSQLYTHTHPSPHTHTSTAMWRGSTESMHSALAIDETTSLSTQATPQHSRALAAFDEQHPPTPMCAPEGLSQTEAGTSTALRVKCSQELPHLSPPAQLPCLSLPPVSCSLISRSRLCYLVSLPSLAPGYLLPCYPTYQTFKAFCCRKKGYSHSLHRNDLLVEGCAYISHTNIVLGTPKHPRTNAQTVDSSDTHVPIGSACLLTHMQAY